MGCGVNQDNREMGTGKVEDRNWRNRFGRIEGGN